jgi:hypothetical protein
MKNRHFFITMAWALAVLLLGWSTPYADDRVHTLSGNITAIDLDYDTVVVDVPMGDQELTVGGPVVENAELSKNGREADLNDFEVGDRVVVTWERTDKGVLIQRLVQRD